MPDPDPPPLRWWETSQALILSGILLLIAGVATLAGGFRQFEREWASKIGMAVFWGAILTALFIVGNFVWMLAKKRQRKD